MKNIINAVTNSTSVQVYGSPRQNRLHLNGNAGAKIAQGDYITITADGVSDRYEFRDSTPPLGGTAGRIWVYNGADAAASRANLTTAIFGTVNANVVTRTVQAPTAGTNTVKVIAFGGSAAAHAINICEWTTAGYTALSFYQLNPTVVSLTATENLTEVGDVWDQASFYNGAHTCSIQAAATNLTINANMITTGTTELFAQFTTADIGFTHNRNRAQNEIAYYSNGAMAELTLNGGASPNNQPGDVISVLLFEHI